MRYSIALLAAARLLSTAFAAASCPPLELIYARATTEPVGLGAAGKSLAKHLETDLPGSTSYAVVYPASMDLNGGGCTGVKDMIRRIAERFDSCPGIKLALGGHSQGGAVVAVGVPQIPKKYLSSIVAVTMFGSPPCSDMPQVAGHCKSFCNKGDTICDSTGAMGNGGPRIKCNAGIKGRSINNRGLAYPRFAAPPPLNESEALEIKQFNQQAGTCGEDERGHVIKGGGTGMTAHMAYNQDGYYVTAASCYIAKMYKAVGGSA